MLHTRGVPSFGDFNLNIKTGRKLVILLALVFAFSFVSASVNVVNYSVDKFYSPSENITGEINLTIVGERYDELITSNDGDKIKLGNFLVFNGVDFDCSPPDCSNDYSFSGGATDKIFSVPSSGNVYAGIVVNGEDIIIKSLSFDLESDFEAGAARPLSIKFFEREEWGFSDFSNEYLTKKWGCYDPVKGSESFAIGDVLYCEMIRVPDTDSMKVGVQIGGSDVGDLDMTVFPETGTGSSWFCSYNPNSENGCIISSGLNDIFSAGNYQVCVSSKKDITGYKIYTEEKGNTCGFIHEVGPDNSSLDYAIYAQGAKYADASLLSSADFGNKDVIAAANDLIRERYFGDCSDSCVLPLAFSGVSQDARIHNLTLTFTKKGNLDSSNTIYDLGVIPAVLDFKGLLDLSSLGFNISKTMKYIVSLSGVKLFEEFLEVLPAPVILSIIPLDPPAGVPIRFYASVNYTDNKTLTYKWKFGDNSSETTSVPFVMHTYADLKNYTLNFEVSAGGNLTSNKNFVISTVSPEVAVNISLGFRRNALNSVMSQLAVFPAWYSGPLGKLINVDFFKGELDRIERESKNAFSDDDFIDIAIDLYSLDVPADIYVESFESFYMLTQRGDIDIKPVEIIAGGVTGATSESYANSILNWQNENIDASFSSNKFSVVNYSQEVNDIFRTYSFDVKMKDNREAYFVINRPFSELYFKESVGARNAGDDATVIILPAESDTSFEFYYANAEPTTFFVSPKLSSIIIEEDIDTSCNYNLVCEEEYGEDYKTCRSDCKPTTRAIVYVILSLVFVLILYTALQIWYKRRYEGFLFKDRRQLYNLLMYVTNARARGMKDDRIAAELRKQGWSSERVNYIIKKSRGQRTGLYEIIPFGKISAFFRNRAAVKRVVTEPQQQIRRNINKSGFPRSI